ncbi:MAG TPA: hypothetical protein VJH23_01890 [archaeon]|nr:hypothetical protein [archaeon]
MAKTIEKIDSILERNARVESDKAWEVSKFRRGIIAVATYLLVLYFLILINAPNPYLNAFVPAIAYLLQQGTFPALKKFWLEKTRKK